MGAWRATRVERAAEAAAGRRDSDVRGPAGRWRERGVVHTPPEVARFVAVRVDRALRGLGRRGGLADRSVALIDPACGPGAFLAAALAVAGRRRRDGPPAAVVGLDVDPEAVASAEDVLGDAARRAGWPLDLRVADTLASLDPFAGSPGGQTTVALVGNPPWAGRTHNRDAAVTAELLEDFRRDGDGRRLEERKIGVLSDDYVRFFRWASEVARRAPGGAVLGFVTNGSYLDGPVHRAMRGALLRWFDSLEIVDLGGSALLATQGPRDENVFGVRPSAAIAVAARAPGPEPRCGGGRSGLAPPHSTSCPVRRVPVARGSAGRPSPRPCPSTGRVSRPTATAW